MLYDYVMARSWNIMISNKFESESGSSVGNRKAIANGSVKNVCQFPASSSVTSSTIKTLHHQGIISPNREYNEKNTVSKLVTGATFFEALEALFIDIRRHPHSVDSMEALKRFPYHTSVCTTCTKLKSILSLPSHIESIAIVFCSLALYISACLMRILRISYM